MELYVSQHGEATFREEDPERSLTERGRAETARVARAAAAAGLTVHRIWHSGKRRARETAEIFADELELGTGRALGSYLRPEPRDG